MKQTNLSLKALESLRTKHYSKTFTFEEYQEYQEKTNKIIGRINKQLSKKN